MNKMKKSRQGGKNFSQKKSLPEVSRQSIRLIPLSGLDEFGKNMWVLEQEGDILLLEMGVESPGADQPGIDWVIPNTQYLSDKQDKIQGVVFTSPHFDHIGAAPYLMSMYPDLDVYASEALFAVLESRENFYARDIGYKKHIIHDHDSLRIGPFKVVTFPVKSNVPGTIGLCIYTMQGKIMYLSTYKMDTTSHDNPPQWLSNAQKLAGDDTTLLMTGSVSAEAEGFAPPEEAIAQEIYNMCDHQEGKVFISTFPSMLGRLQQIVDAAEQLDKHIFIEGKSILNTFNTAKKKGYISIQPGTIVSPQSLEATPDEKLIVILSGASGDDVPHLMRMANREHERFQFSPGDLVAYPSELIPGNERSVSKINDNLSKLGTYIHHFRALGTTHSGHARADDIRMLYRHIKAKYVAPINGPFYLLRRNADLALESGYTEKQTVIGKNGRILLFDYKQQKYTPESVPSYDVLVDGLGVGDLKDVVIRDRQVMSSDGIVNLVALVDSSNKKVIEEPDIISKGFVDMESSQKLIEEVKRNVGLIIEGILQDAQEINTSYVRDELRDQIGQFLYVKTGRRPMILPVVVTI